MMRLMVRLLPLIVLGTALCALANIILTRKMNASEYGAFSFFLSSVNLTALIGLLGFQQTLPRFLSLYEREREQGLTFGFIIATVVLVVVGSAITTAVGIFAVVPRRRCASWSTPAGGRSISLSRSHRDQGGAGMLGQEHLSHLITDEQRARFEADGYLRVPGALSPGLVAELEELVDQIYAEHQQRGFDPYTGQAFAANRAFFFPNFLPRDQRFVNLLDWPPILPLMWGLLGWNIYNYHTHLIVTPPRDPADPQTARLNFHQDSGRVNQELESSPRPRLSIKVAYWLTDLSVPGRGNLYVIPGSHLHDRIELPPEDQLAQGILPADAVPICCAPGDAVMFDRRIWHAATPNNSGVTRKGLFYGYGYRWLRPKDDMTISPEMLAHNDPIRRQLMGDGVDANGHFSPTDADVPLRGWLAANGLPV